MLLRRIAPALFLAGLACEDSGVQSVELGLDYPEQIELGRASVGVSVDFSVTLEATGRLPVRLRDFVVDGPSGRLEIDILSSPTVVLPDQPVELELVARPLQSGSLQAELRFQSDVIEDAEHVVQIRVEGVQDGLEVRPDPVDFGLVRLGDRWMATFDVINRLTGPVELRLPVDSGARVKLEGTADSFSVEAPIDAAGLWGRLEPDGRAELSATFVPSREGEVVARLEFAYCDQPLCRQTVEFRGTGVSNALRCEPLTLDFGFVPPGRATTETVRCSNPTRRGIELRTPVLSGPDAQAFRIEDVPSRLGAGEAVDIGVVITPPESARRQNLSARLDIEARSVVGPPEFVGIPMRAAVAKPELLVLPEVLAFGRVAVGVEVTRTVSIANAGDRPVTIEGVTVPPLFSVSLLPGTLLPGESVTGQVALTAESEGPLSGSLVVQLDDRDLSNPEVPLTASALFLPPCQVQITPPSLSFGLVRPLDAQQRSVLVLNTSSFACLVRSPMAEGDAFTALELNPDDVVLAPGQSIRVAAQFVPPQPGEYRGQLRVPVSDPLRPVRTVDLVGVSAQGSLRVSPGLVDFGTVRPLCRSRTRSVRIFNLGAAPLLLDRVELSTPEFELVRPPAGVPAPPGPGLSLLGGQSTQLNLRYQPAAPGVVPPALLSVAPQGVAAATTVELRAAAIDGPTTERFAQGPTDKVDVLFVIDNSPSMLGEQTQLLANVGRFLNVLDSARADYQVAVVSTDMDGRPQTPCPGDGTRPSNFEQGECGFFSEGDAVETRPEWRVIDRNEQPSPQQAFTRTANLGLSGAHDESGLAAAAVALSAANRSGHNAGFLRNQAALAVIFISDEDDESPGTTESYIAGLRSLKARPEDITVSAIIQTGMSCGIQGQDYAEAAAAFGGVVASTCTSDWSGPIQDIAERALGIRSRFDLAGLPEPATIEVRVNGSLVPELAPITGRRLWTLVEQRAIVFEEDSVPGSGADIAVTYVPACP